MKKHFITKPQAYQVSTNSGVICFNLRKSSRRRSLEISISGTLDVEVRAPSFMPYGEICDFIHQKSRWILARLRETEENNAFIAQKEYKQGQEFLFMGKKYPLNINQGSVRKPQIHFTGQSWLVVIPLNMSQKYDYVVKSTLIHWYKRQARELFGSRVFYFARLMGLEPLRVCVKSQKSLWGSCGLQKKSINLNWKLILTPLNVLDYVIVHELSHFVFPNHSKRFWKKVAKFIPDYKDRQRWLKVHHLDMVMP